MSALVVPISATATVVYNNIPAPLPGNLPSVGFQATSTSEFGGLVEFAATQRREPAVTVVMSVWACEFGSGATCATVSGATFPQQITLNIYNVNAITNEPEGAPISTTQQTFQIPYRPTENKKCPGSPEGKGWGKECFKGKTYAIVFHPTEVTLPAKAILSVAYNTQSYGAKPTGVEGPYNSLNVAVTDGEAPPSLSVGKDPLPEYAYANSQWGAIYEPEPHGVVGTFSLANGWTGYQPTFKVTAKK
ncbi:MAG TPA: hypothetical protein VNR42_11595 [Solirubrobacteraceae bacterium]|nr:hypothetical protein [Solirubrobacteraceae bacterium]